MATPRPIVFDVDETPLDLETTAATFERIFGEKNTVRPEAAVYHQPRCARYPTTKPGHCWRLAK
jgi:hypothetical protein